MASGAIVALVLSIGLPLSAQAQTVEDSLDEAVAVAFQAQLENLAAESGDAMTFDNVTVDVSPATLIGAGSTDPDEIAAYLFSSAELDAKSSNSLLAPRATSTTLLQPIASSTATRKTQFYTADQSSVIPAFGVAWVNQDMDVTFTGNTINSVRLRGNSYGTGIALFAYTHISTSLEYRLNRTCLYTRMRGTFSALVKGSFLSFAATGLATDAPRGGRMVSLAYWQC